MKREQLQELRGRLDSLESGLISRVRFLRAIGHMFETIEADAYDTVRKRIASLGRSPRLGGCTARVVPA